MYLHNLKTWLEVVLVLASLLFLGYSFLPSPVKNIVPGIKPLLPLSPPSPKKPILPWRRREEEDLEDLELIEGSKARPLSAISLGGKVAPDNKTEVQIDYPLSEHIKNIGSKVDGAGMCVMSSIEMASRWSNMEKLRGLRDWCAKEPGGGYPEKVDRQLEKYAKAFLDGSKPDYIQYEGKDPQILKTALETGRFPAVTYSGRDRVRYNGSIAHMVCLAHLDANWAAIWDNNGNPGELIWMTPKEFADRWTDGSSGWAFIWISPPPPPLPKR
jgi:hypothetical protein